jgi:hypothetical protein
MSLQATITVPLRGKTYCLHGQSTNSDAYYRKIAGLGDLCLARITNVRDLLTLVQKMSRRRRYLRTLARKEADGSFEAFLIHQLRDGLFPYSTAVQSHLQGLSGFQRWDRTLTTSEEQYCLYMLEIELVNRLHLDEFRQSTTKLAFLPHCLRDLSASCRATEREIDYVCKGCSNQCKVNCTTKLLRRHGIKPYIWMTANLRSLFKRLKRDGRNVGVLGIACIPELVRGMRLCMRCDVPVVGVPLDANRCARWWGEFHWNTVNFERLEMLLCANESRGGLRSVSLLDRAQRTG